MPPGLAAIMCLVLHGRDMPVQDPTCWAEAPPAAATICCTAATRWSTGVSRAEEKLKDTAMDLPAAWPGVRPPVDMTAFISTAGE
jgi:hypothetical protein